MNNGYIYYGFLKYNKNYQNDTWEYVYSNIDLSNCLDSNNLFYLPLVSRTGKILHTKKYITYLALVPTFPSNNLKLELQIIFIKILLSNVKMSVRNIQT